MEEKLEDVMCGDEYAQAMEAVQELLAVAPKVKKLLEALKDVENDEKFERLSERFKKLNAKVYAIERNYAEIDQKKDGLKNYLGELNSKKSTIVSDMVSDVRYKAWEYQKQLSAEAEKLEKRYQEALKNAAAPVRTQMTNEVVSVIQGLKSEGVEITDAVVASVLNACSYSNWQANQKELKNGYGR